MGVRETTGLGNTSRDRLFEFREDDIPGSPISVT